MRTGKEAEPVSKTAPRRQPTSVSRRVNVATFVLLAVTFLLISFPAGAQKRREAILRLRDDVSTAVAHASLNEKQTQALDRCQQTLLLAAQSGRARQTVNEKDLHGALREIEKTLRNGPFPAEDRTLVEQDIDRVRTIDQNRHRRPHPRQRVTIYPGN